MPEPKKTASDLRERKRRLTLDRIAETGLELFAQSGYESTTLEAIAAACGISRRTFFHYLKSKEDVLMAHESGSFPLALRPTFLAQSPRQSPLSAARKTFLSLASTYETPAAIAADRIVRANAALRLRKDAMLLQVEDALAEAMYALWPTRARRAALRLDALLAVGALRLAREQWRLHDAARPLTYYIDQAFDRLEQRLKRRGEAGAGRGRLGRITG